MNGIDRGDTAFMLISSALVLFMTPGLAFFYGGMVRSKNVVNTMMMSFTAMAVVTVQWVVCGYSLAFGPAAGFAGKIFGGLQWFGLQGVGLEANPDYAATIPHQLFMIYQAMFAIITPALISGAIVERFRFRSFAVFVVLWSTISYDLIAHWVWGANGWLHSLGALDFAGGTVVHVNAGVAALVATLMLGPRLNFPHRVTPPHNVTLVMLGAGMLWFGWFGFNAGSALGSGTVATVAFVTTNIAAGAAMLGWMLIESSLKGKPTAVGAITGAVAGLVAITPACGFVTPVGALCIGFGSSIVCYWALNQRMKWNLDDTLDAFSVHGVGGIFGALATGVFASKAVNSAGADGLIYGNARLVGVQGVAVLATAAFSAAVTWVLIKLISAVAGVRSAEEHEYEGLDVVEHGERAYHEIA
jgi:ammonium transporter, Amt family